MNGNEWMHSPTYIFVVIKTEVSKNVKIINIAEEKYVCI